MFFSTNRTSRYLLSINRFGIFSLILWTLASSCNYCAETKSNTPTQLVYFSSNSFRVLFNCTRRFLHRLLRVDQLLTRPVRQPNMHVYEGKKTACAILTAEYRPCPHLEQAFKKIKLYLNKFILSLDNIRSRCSSLCLVGSLNSRSIIKTTT